MVGSWTSHPNNMLVKHSALGIRGKNWPRSIISLIGNNPRSGKKRVSPPTKEIRRSCSRFSSLGLLLLVFFFSVGVFVFFLLASHPRFQGLNCAFAICWYLISRIETAKKLFQQLKLGTGLCFTTGDWLWRCHNQICLNSVTFYFVRSGWLRYVRYWISVVRKLF